MNEWKDMLWIETRKALRSKLPVWTALGSLFMPIGIAFLIYLARNPEVSQRLGLVGAKANLVTYAAIDWSAYWLLSGQMIAAGGFFLFVLIIAWIFGREFADGTLKDLLAVPVRRASILAAKFCVAAAWSLALGALMILAGLVTGMLIRLPGGSLAVILQGSLKAALTAFLTMIVVLPFALFASVGRGYLLPLSMAVFTLILTNMVVVLGWGEVFPYSVPILLTQAKTPLSLASYVSVLLTLLGGLLATYLWWKVADQNR